MYRSYIQETVCCLETSVTNYQPRPRYVPEGLNYTAAEVSNVEKINSVHHTIRQFVFSYTIIDHAHHSWRFIFVWSSHCRDLIEKSAPIVIL
jgi:hypothetical protein